MFGRDPSSEHRLAGRSFWIPQDLRIGTVLEAECMAMEKLGGWAVKCEGRAWRVAAFRGAGFDGHGTCHHGVYGEAVQLPRLDYVVCADGAAGTTSEAVCAAVRLPASCCCMCASNCGEHRCRRARGRAI